MQTDRLIIRHFHMDDAGKLFMLLSDAAVMRYIEPPYSYKDTVSFLKTAGLGDAPLIYAVDDTQGRFVGYVIYHVYDESSYEIGWVLNKEMWHKGYAQELTKALVEDAKSKGRSLVIECVPEQLSTKRIALAYGFAFCGSIDNCDVYRLNLH